MIKRYWPIAVLLAAPAVLMSPVLLTGRVLYWGVPLLQFYGWQNLAAEMWRAGQAPLWNSLAGSGAPLAANLQTGAFYPLNALHLIWPTEVAQSYTALLHVVLAGLFMYAYLRTLKLSPLAAVIGALAYQLCGFFIARLAFFSVTAAFPWIAAWLWRAEKLVGSERWSVSSDTADERLRARANERVSEHAQVDADSRSGQSPASEGRNPKSDIQNVLWLALVIGLGILAGHAQTAVYGLIFVSLYVVWRTIADRAALRHFIPRSLLLFGVAALLGLALAGVQLLPAAELTRESQRAGGLDYTRIMTHSFWPLRVLTLFSPDFFGNPAQNNFWGYDNYWENAAYIGGLPLLLALWVMGKGIGEWRSGIKGRAMRRDSDQANEQASDEAIERESKRAVPVTHHSSLVIFCSLAVVVSLVLAFGWFTPIYPWLYENVPGFDLFQGPARWLVVTEAALGVLAALGAQRWLEQGFSRRAARRLMVSGLALALAGLVAWIVLTGRVSTFGPATLRFGVVLIVAGVLFRARIGAGRTQVVTTLIVAADLIGAHIGLNPTLPPEVYHAPNPAAEAIRADGARGRVFMFDADENALKFGKYLATDQKFIGYGPNELAYWLDFRATLTPNAAMIDGVASANNFDSLIVGGYQDLLDHINALSMAQAQPMLARMNVAYIASPRSLDLPIVTQTPGVTIYAVPQPWPRAYLVSDAANPADVVTTDAIEGSVVGSLTDSGNAVTIRAASPQNGRLILNDVWYPGWQAAIDGRPAPIEIANGAFRAVRFPAGTHTVEFVYAPQSVSIGAAVTLTVGLIVIIGLVWAGRRPNRG